MLLKLKKFSSSHQDHLPQKPAGNSSKSESKTAMLTFVTMLSESADHFVQGLCTIDPEHPPSRSIKVLKSIGDTKKLKSHHSPPCHQSATNIYYVRAETDPNRPRARRLLLQTHQCPCWSNGTSIRRMKHAHADQTDQEFRYCGLNYIETNVSRLSRAYSRLRKSVETLREKGRRVRPEIFDLAIFFAQGEAYGPETRHAISTMQHHLIPHCQALISPTQDLATSADMYQYRMLWSLETIHRCP